MLFYNVLGAALVDSFTNIIAMILPNFVFKHEHEHCLFSNVDRPIRKAVLLDCFPLIVAMLNFDEVWFDDKT